MNQHLQSILDLIQQSGHLSAEEKAVLLKAAKDADKEFEITSFKLNRTEKVKRTTSILLEETIEELEQKRKAVEAQNRELEIESSLERVRTVAMSMKEPADMLEVCKIISHQLQILNVKEIRNVQTAIFYESKGTYMNYEYYAKHDKTFITETTYSNNKIHNAFANQMLKGNGEFFITHIKGDEVKDWIAYQKTTNVFIDTYLETASSLNYYWYSLGPVALGISTYEPLKEDDINLFKRFLKVFELSYTRYLDIEQAIAQAKESQIQLALERVRARTMAMQKSEELPDAANLLFQQMQALDMPAWSAGYCIWDADKKGITLWMSSEGVMQPSFHTPLTEDPSFIHFREAYERRESFHVEAVGGDELVSHYKYMRTLPGIGEILDSIISAGHPLPTFQIFHCAYFSQGFLLFITYEPIPEAHDIFKRFAKVFEQTYTRFLDLQKAETQVRESQIQLALERARAQSMMMQHSKELDDTLRVFHEQVLLLGINSAFSFLWLPDEDKDRHIFWAAWAENNSTIFKSKAVDYPLDRNEPATAQCLVDWKGNEPVVSYNVPPAGVKSYFAAWQELIAGVEQLKPEYFSDGLYYVEAFMKYGCFGVIIKNDLSEEEKKILLRFTIEFERTYTRFLDLQKAEVQTRESQIQLALERVRARTMAMQKSDELGETSFVLFQQFKDLGETSEQISIGIFNEDKNIMELYSTLYGSQWKEAARVDLDEPVVMKKIHAAWKKQQKSLVIDLSGNDLKKYNSYRKKLSNLEYKEDRWVIHIAFFSKGVLTFSTTEPHKNETVNLLERFAGVFDGTYTRFLDLKKAEAQTRESQIQLALERARAQSMMMQHSTELDDTLRVFHEQVLQLDIPSAFSFLWLPDEEKSKHIFWATWAENNSTIFKSKAINYPLDRKEPATAQCLIDWKSSEPVVAYHVPPEGVENYFAAWSELIAGVEELKPQNFSDGLFYVEAFMKYGCFGVMVKNTLPEDEKEILSRFAVEFERAYTRFLDLQKAEAQAREAQIEAAMEKVRARAMAMQKPNELIEVAQLLRKEMGLLGVEELETSSIYIHDETTGKTECWYAITKEDKQEKKLVSDHMTIDLEETWVGKEMLAFYRSGKKQISIPMKGVERKEWINYCAAHSKVLEGFYGDNIPDRTYHLYKFSRGYIGAASPGNISVESWNLLQRATSVFSLAYTRFSDLQQAEAQARESQIEAALERVRSRAMAMQTSEELNALIGKVFTELTKLELVLTRSVIIIYEPDGYACRWWMANSESPSEPMNFLVNYDEQPFFDAFRKGWQERNLKWIFELEGQDKVKTDNFLFAETELSQLPDFVIAGMRAPDKVWLSASFNNFGCLTLASLQPLPDEHFDILLRFAKVFDLTYTRFNDLKQAEAQSREAQIELSLERVRAKTMAMHNSADVGETVAVMFDELVKLGIQTYRCGIGIMQHDNKMEVWTAKSETSGKVDLVIGRLDMTMHPLLHGAYNNWKNKKDFFSYELKGKDLIRYYTVINNYSDYPVKYEISSLPSTIIHNDFYFAEGSLFVFSIEKLKPESIKIFKRFASVFGQTYRRFLDLQKAEAQARESQIEAALERVRASTMAMHKSEDLAKTAVVLFAQLNALGNIPDRISIGIINESEGVADMWLTDQSGNEIDSRFILNLNEKTTVQKLVKGWKDGLKSMTVDLTGEELKMWLNYVRKIGLIVKDEHFKNRRVHNVVFFSHGWLNISSLEPLSSDMINILERFAAVYNLTYRRFLDLQKAEAQAREAQIEAALERVRGKAMAMQNSNDVSVAASMVFTELRKLGINPIRCGVGLFNKESQKTQLYSATSSPDGDSLSLVGWVIMTEHPVLEKIYESWLNNEEYYPELQGEQLRSYYQLLLRGLPVTLPDVDDDKKQYGHFLPFSIGCLNTWSDHPHNESEIKILRRFATIIDLTFRRYLELQKSEANAREAVKQAAVDRIRADIASMRTINDLDRITPLIWNELTILGVPFIRCGVFLMNDEQQLIHTFLSTPDGKAIAAFHIPYDTPGNIKHVISHWRDNKNYIDHWDESAFTDFAHMLTKQGGLTSPEQYLKTIPHGGFYLHFLPFLQGMLYVGNINQLSEEEINLIQSVADAFSTAYARYEDFNKLEAAKQQVDKTLVELKQTQQQLVQSEKMASLGELTAGIAHEIQNPLNFVNNFSEVNEELLIELIDEFDKGNAEEAKAIANDIKQNLEKINHHGKRADAIVKNMLQHSRQTKGIKEPTDINSLCDEYLRLSYHGLRAKDKNFNAEIKTDFDTSIGKINIVPQDIGRVLLNLYNNAFYAINEKFTAHSSPLTDDYKPLVSIQTKSIAPLQGMGAKVEIIVTDNGNGIPASIKEKIFQPFFTTKPTGQGTGLGLSLSYDIIKAHGGEIKVETKEGEGTEFIIQLPIT